MVSLLAAVALFASNVERVPAHLSRDLNGQYKTALMLAHKLHEAMGGEFAGRYGMK